jgi:SAM-dependent methyltransferase
MMEILLSKLFDRLRTTKLDETYDDEFRINFHEKVIETNWQIKRTVEEMHYWVLDKIFHNSKLINLDKSVLLELGSGVIPYSNLDARFISSDISFNKNMQLVCDAQNLPIKKDSIGGLVGQFVFHHLQDPANGLRELERVMKPKSRVIFIEPANTFLGKLIFPFMHKSEYYDEKANWTNAVEDLDRKANQALSFIVFVRDRQLFEKMFPGFRIMEIVKMPQGVRYMACGGLNFRKIMPNSFINFIRMLEKYFPRIISIFAVHWCVVIEKI